MSNAIIPSFLMVIMCIIFAIVLISYNKYRYSRIGWVGLKGPWGGVGQRGPVGQTGDKGENGTVTGREGPVGVQGQAGVLSEPKPCKPFGLQPTHNCKDSVLRGWTQLDWWEGKEDNKSTIIHCVASNDRNRGNSQPVIAFENTLSNVSGIQSWLDDNNNNIPPNVRLQPGNEQERQNGCYAGKDQTRANMSGRTIDGNITGQNNGGSRMYIWEGENSKKSSAYPYSSKNLSTKEHSDSHHLDYDTSNYTPEQLNYYSTDLTDTSSSSLKESTECSRGKIARLWGIPGDHWNCVKPGDTCGPKGTLWGVDGVTHPSVNYEFECRNTSFTISNPNVTLCANAPCWHKLNGYSPDALAHPSAQNPDGFRVEPFQNLILDAVTPHTPVQIEKQRTQQCNRKISKEVGLSARVWNHNDNECKMKKGDKNLKPDYCLQPNRVGGCKVTTKNCSGNRSLQNDSGEVGCALPNGDVSGSECKCRCNAGHTDWINDIQPIPEQRHRKTPACNKCNAGLYKGNIGDGNCVRCSKGYKCPRKGMTNQELCSPGTYQNQVEQKSCKLCRGGKYCNSNGMTTQNTCQAGSFSPEPQSGARIGNINCIQCRPGTFQDEAGKSYCKRCIGKANSYGLTDCESCPKGNIIVNNDCVACPQGTKPNKDSSRCVTCPSGGKCKL
jgi:hypothetical protein